MATWNPTFTAFSIPDIFTPRKKSFVAPTLRKRIRTHYRGNAAGSTLRQTLGCLLSSQLAIQLRRVGSGGRYTFTNPGEQALDRWMDQHAFVTWVETDAAWGVEKKLLSSGPRLPLNVDGNASLEAAAILSQLTAHQRREALERKAAGECLVEIGRSYNVSHSTISRL